MKNITEVKETKPERQPKLRTRKKKWNSVRVGGVKYRVKYFPLDDPPDFFHEMEKDYTITGYCDAGCRVIGLAKDTPDMDYIMFHEVVHAAVEAVPRLWKLDRNEADFGAFCRVLWGALVDAKMVKTDD